jgi:hypothetical protein
MQANENVTAAHTGGRLRARRPDRLRRECELSLRDPTAPASRARAALPDDGSHTPPHGDAVLPRRKRRA